MARKGKGKSTKATAYRHDESRKNIPEAGLIDFVPATDKRSKQEYCWDPPYGSMYASNFQPGIDQRDVDDGKDEDLSREVMQVQAFRDNWELVVHN